MSLSRQLADEFVYNVYVMPWIGQTEYDNENAVWYTIGMYFEI